MRMMKFDDTGVTTKDFAFGTEASGLNVFVLANVVIAAYVYFVYEANC
jgi:hypothetical protein